MTRAEDIIVPFPPSMVTAPVTTACRSTLLVTSLQGLKQRGFERDYQRAVSPECLATITSSVAGMWLPLSTAIAHYTACDRICPAVQDQLALGGDSVRSLQRTFLATVLKTATVGAGITPWTALSKFSTIYQRLFQGGGTSIVKLGPKDARAEVVGQPLAAIPYFRNAYRGFLSAGCEFFATRVFVTELPRQPTTNKVGYRISWV
jgi:hypothetical protein